MKVLDRLPGGYVFVQGQCSGRYRFSHRTRRDELAQTGFYTAVVRLNDNADLLTAPKIVSEGFMSKATWKNCMKALVKSLPIPPVSMG